MPEIISRSDAKARGLKLYFTGRPCKLGHESPRTTAYGVCVECSRVRARRFREKYPEKARKKRCRSDKRHPALISAKNRQYYSQNRDKILSANRSEKKDLRRNYQQKRQQAISDLLIVLRKEMPDLLKEFGL